MQGLKYQVVVWIVPAHHIEEVLEIIDIVPLCKTATISLLQALHGLGPVGLAVEHELDEWVQHIEDVSSVLEEFCADDLQLQYGQLVIALLDLAPKRRLLDTSDVLEKICLLEALPIICPFLAFLTSLLTFF